MSPFGLDLVVLCLCLTMAEAWSLERRDASPVIKPAPISFPISEHWEAGEGSWSSFIVRLGSGPTAQVIRVHPSTSMSTVWTVMAGFGCPDEWPGGLSACTERRGGTYDSSKSTGTYKSRNNYTVGAATVLKNYGLENEGVHMALETTSLGYPQSGGLTLDDNIVFEFGSLNFTLQGLVGLYQAPVNLSDTGGFGYPNPSFIQTMRNSKYIPSVAYGYTAGAKYRSGRGVFASLTLGGYDDKRFNTTQQATFPFELDNELALTVNMDSISWGWAGSGVSSTSDATILGKSMPALIDSSRPFIYLSPAIVTSIAKAWGLQWVPMPIDGYWVINNTQFNVMDQQKPFLRFNIGQSANGLSSSPSSKTNDKTAQKPQSVTITLPWEALVQDLDFPYAENKTKFIPIRSTENAQAYMLGRTFLQEAYLTVDYERSIFSVAPALFPSPDQKHILPICAKNETCTTQGETKPAVPVTTIAGAAAGAGVLIIILILALFFLRKAKLRKRRQAEEAAIAAQKESELNSPFSPNSPSDKRMEVMEIDSDVIHEAGGTATYPVQELETKETTWTSEMPDESTLSTFGGHYREMKRDDGMPIIKVFYEMDATPTSSAFSTPTGTLSSGDTLVSSVSGLAPPNTAHLRQHEDGQGDLSPIPQTPLEYYGAAASNGPAGQRGWIGRPPDMPRVVLTPATPASPSPEEVERNRWLKGHSGRGRKKRNDGE